MSNRWKMNRMGFVNFWLYDEETFSFADGKIFLRGANASGKSITTQSFIPFILDGDRSPERLDPFGSKDRKMEYYFLGNGEKDDVTGYLFLEFRKGDTQQYRTIGIGQKAQKGKQMSFWGFLILDGKRIGYDVNLYREVGSKKIPYPKQELKKILGEENVVADSQTEYMDLVNKHIFGFPRREQYDQFIRLMIKVRAPKLSRDFRPTKVYEILNESLQTLSDEDLRAMVDAMEKMDDIQGRLDALKEAFKDLQSIRSEYDHYNRYMLSKKAQAYTEAKRQVDTSRNRLEAYKDELNAAQEDKAVKEFENRQLTERIEVLEKENEILNAKDIEASVDQLRNRKDKEAELDKETKGLEGKIEEYRSKIREYDVKQRNYKNAVENHQYEIDKILQELETINETLLFEQHSTVKAAVKQKENDIRNEFSCLRSALKAYSAAVDKGLKALREAFQIEAVWNRAEEELSGLNLNRANLRAQLETAESMEIQCRDSIVEAFYVISERYQELIIERPDLDSIISCVKKYEGAKDLGAIRKTVNDIYTGKSGKLFEQQLQRKRDRADINKQYLDTCKGLEELRNMKAPVPERKDKVVKARKLLLEKGIHCLPFYETVEFDDTLTEEEQALLEEQLFDAGLLDALVVSGKEYEKAKGELEHLSDILLHADADVHTGFHRMVPGELESELRVSVEQILNNIYPEYAVDAKLVLSADGYFKNGVIEGHSIAEGQASFVGILARRRKLLRLIEEKEAECRDLGNCLQECDQDLEEIENSVKNLKEEYEKLPSFDDLDQSIEMVREADYLLTKAGEECVKKEKELAEIVLKKKACDQNVIVSCKVLPFERTEDSYQAAVDSIEDYRGQLTELESEIGYLRTAESNVRNIQDLVEKEEDMIEDANLQLRKIYQALKVCKAEIVRLEEFLNSPDNRERAEKVEKIKEELKEHGEKIISNERMIAVLDSKIGDRVKDIDELKEAIIDVIAKENKLRVYYQEELELGLVFRRESRSIDECAAEAIASIRDNDRDKSLGEVITSLNKIYQQRSSNLTSYGTSLENCFEDDRENPDFLRKRQCIVSSWQGKKLYLEDFYCVIKESIDSTELLIQEKDRELFENILADTLSRKLRNRIAESRSWINDMSKLMKDMDTSMGLSFSLDWRPCAADNDKELDTQELEKLLSRDRELLTVQDIDKVSTHFRSKIRLAKQMAEDRGDVINYSDLVREALDYRKWFEFRMYFYREGDLKKELTNSSFNKFSGGEKAMAMYVPLFAAVNAQYKKVDNPDYPRIIALDEAFAGVDDKNISSMFELVQKLDFDYIMNSQALWGCYETVKSLRIAELLRPANSTVVTVIYYYWNGKERILDEQ